MTRHRMILLCRRHRCGHIALTGLLFALLVHRTAATSNKVTLDEDFLLPVDPNTISVEFMEILSYERCPAHTFSTLQSPPICDTTTTLTSTSSTASTTSTISSTTSSTTLTTSTSITTTSRTATSATQTHTTRTSTTSSMTESVTFTSVTATNTSTSATGTSTTSTSITSTSQTATTTSETSTTTSTVTSVTTTSSTITSSSTTRTSTTSQTSTSITTSSSTNTTRTTTSSFDDTTTTSSSTTTTMTVTGSNTTTSTTNTSTITTSTKSTTSSTRTSITSTTSSTSTSSTTTETQTSLTTTSNTSTSMTETSTTSSSTATTTTVLLQQCGNACPLYASDGCKNLQPGEICNPVLMVDPCVNYLTGFSLTCPDRNVDLWRLPDASGDFPMVTCRVCGFGMVAEDQNDKEGYYEGEIFWGQNSVAADINQHPVIEFKVYVVDHLRRKLGTIPVARVPKQVEEEQDCCRLDTYRAHVSTVLPKGYKRFMVVPITNFGHELPAGTVSEEIQDATSGGPYGMEDVPLANFSFTMRMPNLPNNVAIGNGTISLSADPGQQDELSVTIPCRLSATLVDVLSNGLVVMPVGLFIETQLAPSTTYTVRESKNCVMNADTGLSENMMAPEAGFKFTTQGLDWNDGHQGKPIDDLFGPSLLDAASTEPTSGSIIEVKQFFFYFNEVVLRGPGPLAIVRLADHPDRPDKIVDTNPVVNFYSNFPGKVLIAPRVLLEAGSTYEVVFGPGALKDTTGNMAASSKEFEALDEWAHRIACSRGPCAQVPRFGLDDYINKVPAIGGVEEARASDLTFAWYPEPGGAMYRHENLVLEFLHPVSPDPVSNVIELCTNFTDKNVCLRKIEVNQSNMLFVGDKVILNPVEDLFPDYSFNVSIQKGVITNFEGIRPNGSGFFPYTFSVLSEDTRDKKPPVLVALYVDCTNVTWSSYVVRKDETGCGMWKKLPDKIVGDPDQWGFEGKEHLRPMPAGARFLFYFSEAVQVFPENGAVLSSEPVGRAVSMVEEVPAYVGTGPEDCQVTVVPQLLFGELYTLSVGSGIRDMDMWPEPNRFVGAALSFFTLLPAPTVELASNDGMKEAARATVVKLVFEGRASVGDPDGELEVEIRQINIGPANEPDVHRLTVSDPDHVIFSGNEVLIMPSRLLLAGASYNLTLPAGSVRHFSRPFSFAFTTRPEDRVKPSVVKTLVNGNVFHETVDRTPLQVLFSEEVKAEPNKFILISDDTGRLRYKVAAIDSDCANSGDREIPETGFGGSNSVVTPKGCAELDFNSRRLSLLPLGRDSEGHMIPWAEHGRTYSVTIEQAAFSDAVTVGEMLKNELDVFVFSFSVHPDTQGPVLANSIPADGDDRLDPNTQEIILDFDEEIQAVDSNFAVQGWFKLREEESPRLEMLPGTRTVNPAGGVIMLSFNCPVEAGEGTFQLQVDNPEWTPGQNDTEQFLIIKEVDVSDVVFVNSHAVFNPHPLDISFGQKYFVTANALAIRSRTGIPLAEPLHTSAQVQVDFHYHPTEIHLLFTSFDWYLCGSTTLPDIDLYLSEDIVFMNTSLGKKITLQEMGGSDVWSLLADDETTDATRLEVTLDPEIPFKATLHTSRLPSHLPGSVVMPLPSIGMKYNLMVDEGLFEDQPEQALGNLTIWIPPPPPPAPCDTFEFDCGEFRVPIANASQYLCQESVCMPSDNVTCCEDLITTTGSSTSTSTSATTSSTSATTTSSTTTPGSVFFGGRRLASTGEEAGGTYIYETYFYQKVYASPKLMLPVNICETRYQDVGGQRARLYVDFKVHMQVDGRLRPKEFEVSLPTTTIKDALGNEPPSAKTISFAQDTTLPELNMSACYPSADPDGDGIRNGTLEETIVLRFTEPVKAGAGFFELWDVEDTSGPKFRIDVQKLAAASPSFPGRELISGNSIMLQPQYLCEVADLLEPATECGAFGNGVTYFVVTREAGVLYDLMDNPLQPLNTNATNASEESWRFLATENVTRPPEVWKVSEILTTLPISDMNGTVDYEMWGYIYFTQRVFQGMGNKSDPDHWQNVSGINATTLVEIYDCGTDFQCEGAEMINDSDITVTTSSEYEDVGLEYGIAQFKFTATLSSSSLPRRYMVVVVRNSFLGPETVIGQVTGPPEDYSFFADTEVDPATRVKRPKIVAGSFSPMAGASFVSAMADMSMLLTESVLPGEGNVSFCLNADVQADNITGTCKLGHFADGSPATIDIAGHEVLVARRSVTFRPHKGFAFGQKLYVAFPSGLVETASTGDKIAGIGEDRWSFSVVEGDVVPPVAYFAEGTDVPHGTVRIFFSEYVQFANEIGAEGSVQLLETLSGSLVSFNASVSGSVVEIFGPFEAGFTYALHAATSSLFDIAGNQALLTHFPPENFTIRNDTAAPVATLPEDGEVDLNDIFFIELSEATLPILHGNVELVSVPPEYCGVTCGESYNLVQAMPTELPLVLYESGGRLHTGTLVDPGVQLLPGYGYTLNLTAGSYEDVAGNVLTVGKTGLYMGALQKDIKPPEIVLASIGDMGGPNPSYDQEEVAGSGLQVFFSEAVEVLHADTRGLRLEPSSGDQRCSSSGACEAGVNCTSACGYIPASRTVFISTANISISGARASVMAKNIPHLEYGRGYRLVVEPEAFVDMAGNVAGSNTQPSGPADLVFRVAKSEKLPPGGDDLAPILVSSEPVDGQRMVPTSSMVQFMFDRPVQAGPGSFVLVPHDVPCTPVEEKAEDEQEDTKSTKQEVIEEEEEEANTTTTRASPSMSTTMGTLLPPCRVLLVETIKGIGNTNDSSDSILNFVYTYLQENCSNSSNETDTDIDVRSDTVSTTNESWPMEFNFSWGNITTDGEMSELAPQFNVTTITTTLRVSEALDPSTLCGAIIMPAQTCHFDGNTVTCLPPTLMQEGVKYSLRYSRGALKDESGKAVPVGPQGKAPDFTIIDADIFRPRLLTVGPSGQSPALIANQSAVDIRRLSTELAMAPKPDVWSAKGSVLRLEFNERVQVGHGKLVIVDCTPGNSSRCYDGISETRPDDVVMEIEMDKEFKLLYDADNWLTVMQRKFNEFGWNEGLFIDATDNAGKKLQIHWYTQPGKDHGLSEPVLRDNPDPSIFPVTFRAASLQSQMRIVVQNESVFMVTENLQPGRLHALRSHVQGTFKDESANELLPITSGFEFWVQPDDARYPSTFLTVPENGSLAPADTNITLYFGESVQAKLDAVIVITDGIIEQNVSLATGSNMKGESYAIVRDSMVIINPSYDFGFGQTVTVMIEPGTFTDFAGNPFAGFSGEYFFEISPPFFELVTEFQRFWQFRHPRFMQREGALLHYINNSFMLYGGRRGAHCYTDTWVSETGESWRQVPGVESLTHFRRLPPAAHAPSAVNASGCVWMLGGECNDDSGVVWVTCDVGRSWNWLQRPISIPFGFDVPQMYPETFEGHAIAILGGWQLIIVDAAPNSSEAVWRAVTSTAERIQRVRGGRAGELQFGLRRDPALLAKSDGGLYLVGGHLCPPGRGAGSLCGEVFNDVWSSPDQGITWICQTASFAAGFAAGEVWNNLGRYSSTVLTLDDTIYVMGGHKLGTEEEGIADVYQSYSGIGDIYLSDKKPFFVMPGSIWNEQPPALPFENFSVYFGEPVQITGSAVGFFHEAPEYEYDEFGNITNVTQGPSIAAALHAFGKEVVMVPESLLAQGKNYTIDLPAGVVEDAVRNPFGHIHGPEMGVSILHDMEAPYLVSTVPENLSFDIEPWTWLTLIMSEDVIAGQGSIELNCPVGISMSVPIEEAVIVRNKVMFKLPRLLTPGQVYTVTYPHGMMHDRMLNKVSSQDAGSWEVLSGLRSYSNYYGILDNPHTHGMREDPPPYKGDLELLDFPALLTSWPEDFATDVPVDWGISVVFFFSSPVMFSMDGYVTLNNETDPMVTIPTSNASIDPAVTNFTYLQVLDLNAPGPNMATTTTLAPADEQPWGAVRFIFPHNGTGTLLIEPGRTYSVHFSEGALEEPIHGNRSKAFSMSFTCLSGRVLQRGPEIVASSIPEGQAVPGSTHKFDIWYHEDIRAFASRDRVPIKLEDRRTGRSFSLETNDRKHVQFDGNRLSLTFPPHVMKAGGQWRLTADRWYLTDRSPRVDGGPNPARFALSYPFYVKPESWQRPVLNMSDCYPPNEEELAAPTYEMPHTGSVLLFFSEPVVPGIGTLTFVPRSYGPHFTVYAKDTLILGNLVMVSPAEGLLPGQVYTLEITDDAFMDYDGYQPEDELERLVVSTRPLMLFRRVGSSQWEDPRTEAPGPRLGASAAVDSANRIFMLGGRSGKDTALLGDALNDVWMLRTEREVNCASSFNGHNGCSRTSCAPDENGVFTLGYEFFKRTVWRARSQGGADCIASDGSRKSKFGELIDVDRTTCDCPTCTAYPGPPDGPDLPLFMINTDYVKDYFLVASSDERPLLCAPGRTPTGNFSCLLDDRYFAIFETPYPTCENSSCPVPPDVASLRRFATLDIEGSWEQMNCSLISHQNPVPHGGECAVKCDPGWKVDSTYFCDQGKFRVPQCWKQMCPDPPSLGNGRLDCEEHGGAFTDAVCTVICKPGHQRSATRTECGTASLEPEAQPFFQPEVACVPQKCSDYKWTEGAIVVHDSDDRTVNTATASVTCTEGYFVAGSALGLSGTIDIACGPMYPAEENRPEVEWQLVYNNKRAGLICTPEGMAVFPKVVLLGTIHMKMELPAGLSRDALCSEFKEKFYLDLGIAIIMGLSSASGITLTAEAAEKVDVELCGDYIAGVEQPSPEQIEGQRRHLRRRLSTTFDTIISFSVRVPDRTDPALFQKTLSRDRTDDRPRSAFIRVFTLALYSASGINSKDVNPSEMKKDIDYEVDVPDGTQVAIVLENSTNDTVNVTINETVGVEEESFIGSAAFIGIVAGGSCCCCLCLCLIAWRVRYAILVDPDFEEAEEEDEGEFTDDPEVSLQPR
eukprot:TRINITY_DN27313_c0_g1_i1.p1 TRINITY_DN27313_c0_g1~~TRINITY_DN27313_c0_g1_i1.p1  ORF type:complete len:4923 (-),score=820.80 TRINITY_DN27313_c0_g1_i1:177-14945(-)